MYIANGMVIIAVLCSLQHKRRHQLLQETQGRGWLVALFLDWLRLLSRVCYCATHSAVGEFVWIRRRIFDSVSFHISLLRVSVLVINEKPLRFVMSNCERSESIQVVDIWRRQSRKNQVNSRRKCAMTVFIQFDISPFHIIITHHQQTELFR